MARIQYKRRDEIEAELQKCRKKELTYGEQQRTQVIKSCKTCRYSPKKGGTYLAEPCSNCMYFYSDEWEPN